MIAAACLAAGAEPRIKDTWQPQPAKEIGGVLGERVKLWREKRLWRVALDPSLIGPFESASGGTAPRASRTGQGEDSGSNPLWQGEHLGKWLHAASLAYEQTHDPKLAAALGESVKRLLAAQKEDGYLGTYAPAARFYAPPGAVTLRSWNIWTARYNLYGLLAYERFHPDAATVRACVRMADLLLATFGPGKRDMTQIGTLLESIVMLYRRTGDARYLEFAQQIVRMSEDNPRFQLLGYGELYRSTGDPRWLRAVEFCQREDQE